MPVIDYYLDHITKNKDNKIIITDGDKDLVGYIDKEISFGASNTFDVMSDQQSSASPELQKKFDDTMKYWNSGKTLLDPQLTKVTWRSSQFDSLSFSFTIVAEDEYDNVMNKVIDVWDWVSPRLWGGFIRDKYSYESPGGYNPGRFDENFWTNVSQVDNALEINIGNWFKSYGWVMTNMNYSVSKEKINNKGHPLYVTVSTTLQPVMTFDGKTIQTWFLNTDKKVESRIHGGVVHKTDWSKVSNALWDSRRI